MRIDLIGKRHPLSLTNFDPTGISETALVLAATASSAAASTAGAAAAIGAGTALTLSSTAAAGVSLGSLALGASAVAGLAGAGVSAYGQYQQGLAQKNMYSYQQQEADLQANYDLKIGAAQSEADQVTGSLQSRQLVQNQAELEGSQRATEAAAGTAGSVTAENITSSTFTKQQLDQELLRYNTDVKSYEATQGAQDEAWTARAMSGQYGMAAKNAQTSGELSATGTLLGEAGSVASTAVRLQ